MSDLPKSVFADTAFWLALVVRQDSYHARAHAWATRIDGVITTTMAVILETANTLSRPVWRPHAIRLIDRLRRRDDVEIVDLDGNCFNRGWDLYRNRPDKSWGLVDCISFVVMRERGLTAALTTDRHFAQAGYRALLLEDSFDSQ
jgi:hypothetical protein